MVETGVFLIACEDTGDPFGKSLKSFYLDNPQAVFKIFPLKCICAKQGFGVIIIQLRVPV